MLIRKALDLTYADVTPRSVYLDRRKFLRAMGIVGATAVAGRGLFELASPSQTAFASTKLTGLAKSPFSTTEKQNTFEDVTHYNNFYEFGTDKGDPAKNSKNFNTSSWSVSVEGEVKKPRKFTMDEILKIAPLEERIYRHRCVEAWSIVVPWIGFSFSNLIKLVEPTPKAEFVAFQSYFDPQQMPPTTWNRMAPNEYGFYSNVNPSVDHPRWTQSKERRLGEIFKRPTLMFNGYGEQVASLYNGMDLKKNY